MPHHHRQIIEWTFSCEKHFFRQGNVWIVETSTAAARARRAAEAPYLGEFIDPHRDDVVIQQSAETNDDEVNEHDDAGDDAAAGGPEQADANALRAADRGQVDTLRLLGPG